MVTLGAVEVVAWVLDQHRITAMTKSETSLRCSCDQRWRDDIRHRRHVAEAVMEELNHSERTTRRGPA